MKQKHLQPKTRYIAFVAASVDGKISLSNKILPDWTSKEDWRFFQQSLAHIDAVVLGRNTYNLAIEHLRKRKTFVFSSRLKTTKCRGKVTFVNPANINIADFFQEFKTVAVLGGAAVYN